MAARRWEDRASGRRPVRDGGVYLRRRHSVDGRRGLSRSLITSAGYHVFALVVTACNDKVTERACGGFVLDPLSAAGSRQAYFIIRRRNSIADTIKLPTA